MSDSEASAPRRRRISRTLIRLFGVGATFVGVGLGVFAIVPGASPTLQVPCTAGACLACLEPSAAECVVLTRCGGEPCPDALNPDAGVPDPYAGVAGRLARGLRRARDEGALATWHTSHAIVDGGVSCHVSILLDEDQRAAWRRTVDTAAAGSDLVDCRFANLGAKGKTGTARRAVFAGMPEGATGESFPNDVVGALDAGTD